VKYVRPRPILNGARVRAAREARGLTMADLARAAGLAKSHVRDLEGGKRPNLSAGVLWELSRALGVPFGDLLDYPREEPHA
jgi:transcriptional regulator with XRE-family HTH domain